MKGGLEANCDLRRMDLWSTCAPELATIRNWGC
jgi:hypothetical protein